MMEFMNLNRKMKFAKAAFFTTDYIRSANSLRLDHRWAGISISADDIDGTDDPELALGFVRQGALEPGFGAVGKLAAEGQ